MCICVYITLYVCVFQKKKKTALDLHCVAVTIFTAINFSQRNEETHTHILPGGLSLNFPIIFTSFFKKFFYFSLHSSLGGFLSTQQLYIVETAGGLERVL